MNLKSSGKVCRRILSLKLLGTLDNGTRVNWASKERRAFIIFFLFYLNKLTWPRAETKKTHLIWNLKNCFPYRSLYKVHQSLIEETLLWSPIQVLVRDSDWSSRIPHFVNWGSFAGILWWTFFWWYIICWILLFLCQIIFKFSPQAYCPLPQKDYSKTFCSKPILHQNTQCL